MTKILHIITRLDMGGSAQNTLLTCKKFSNKYEIILVHGLSYESRMTDLEKRTIEDGIKEAKTQGVTHHICFYSVNRMFNDQFNTHRRR